MRPAQSPSRPAAVVFAVAVLALLWVGVAFAIVAYGGYRVSFAIVAAVFWTVVWYQTLWRVWRGSALAARFASKAAIGVLGILLLSSPIFIWLTGDVTRILLIDIPCAIGVVAGFALRRSVRQ